MVTSWPAAVSRSTSTRSGRLEISSTDEEKVLASRLAWTVKVDLHSLGWPEPVEADSGNGYHLNIAVDLPADDGGLVERFLQALSAKYTTPAVKVDTSLFNPSRIIKLYGTWSRKGDSIPTRPHRLAMVISGPPIPDDCRSGFDRGLHQGESAASQPEQKPNRLKASPEGRPWTGRSPAGDIPDVDLRPGDDFEARADWINDILGPHGWTIDKELSNGEIRLTRPGKNGGTSATIGHNKGLHVFTDSRDAAPFDAGGNYSKFEACSSSESRRAVQERHSGPGPTWIRPLHRQRRRGQAEPTATGLEEERAWEHISGQRHIVSCRRQFRRSEFG